MLSGLIHQMQLFQQELTHFTTNMEYYIKTRAIQSVYNDLQNQLKEISSDAGCMSFDSTGMTDMDKLVTIHEEFLLKIIKLCMIDSKSKSTYDLIISLLQSCLDFRVLCKRYLLGIPSRS